MSSPKRPKEFSSFQKSVKLSKVKTSEKLRNIYIYMFLRSDVSRDLFNSSDNNWWVQGRLPGSIGSQPHEPLQ